jgi:hypothetical protein
MREICACVYGLTQDGLMVGFGQSTSPLPFVVRRNQRALSYIYTMNIILHGKHLIFANVA